MKNIPDPTAPILPPALARAQRPSIEPSLSSIGIDSFEPAKPGLPGQAPAAPTHVPVVNDSDHYVTGTPARETSPAAPVGDPALHVYIAVFAVKKGAAPGAHTNVKIEVACTGSPQGDVAAAWAEVRRQFPNAPKNHIVRVSGKISPRAGTAAQAIPVPAGLTIRQLFPDKSEYEASRLVGRLSFEGEPHSIILRHLRAKSVFSVTLKPLTGPATINFSEQITTTRLAEELPGILNQLLGDSAKNIDLYFIKS
jgi:hypothetical protein